MKNLLAALLVCATLAAAPMDADAARRFGGGSNLGRPAPTFSQKAPAAAPKAPAAKPGATQNQPRQATPAQQAQRPSMMRGMLTGLAAALGITALLSMLGINGAGMVSLVMGLILAAVLFMALRAFLSRRAAPAGAHRPAGRGSAEDAQIFERRAEPVRPEPVRTQAAASGSVMDQFMGGGSAPAEESGAVDVTPADFDREGFLKVARENYVALQKAWDSGNVLEISDFTTPDVFTAVTHQLRERGHVTQQTTVVELSNELLGIAQEGDEYLASVRFTGVLDVSGEREELDETWVLAKPVRGEGGWLLCAIRQNGPVA